MKSSNKTHSSSVISDRRLAAVFTALVLAFSLTQSRARPTFAGLCCPPVAGDKAIQPPDNTTPINILAGSPSVGNPPYVIADDFKCTTTGPIADIRIWGSFLNDVNPPDTIFTLTFWSDVPNQGGTGFSQPGIVLWSQNFGPGQYNRCVVNHDFQVLYLPQWTQFSPLVATNLYYLCFTPDRSKPPFVQTGGTAPTNYWLSVSTQEATGGQTEFGWKVSSLNYGDTAVYGVAAGPPWSPIYDTNNNTQVNMAFEITTASMPPLCGDTNTPKFFLPPQTAPDQGFDVKDSRNQIVLADDFPCTNTGPITGIQVWGSWLNDQHGTISNFWVGFYADVPPVIGPGGLVISNSHPGLLLWWTNFPAGQFAEIPYTNSYEYFYDPSNNVIQGSDTNVWLYCFQPANPFVQTGSPNAPTNFWLAIRAQLAETNSQIIYGWKSAALPYGDPAVFGTVAGGFPSGNWRSMTNPFTGQPLDLSMRLTSTNSQPPPTGCDDPTGVKYIQPPNTQNGYDVWNSTFVPPGVTDGPWILADDFVCTNTGPITNIHIWGSWFKDQAAPKTITFWVALYDNVATNSANPYSHPGNLIWSQCFGPGEYDEVPWGIGTESFLDPGPGSLLGPESNIWCYSFTPAAPPTQTGTLASATIYWLAVFAQQTVTASQASFGWKTTYGVQNDISVHAPWNAPFCPTNFAGLTFGWIPTYVPGTPVSQPLDLAFKIVTGAPSPPPTPCDDTNGVKYIQPPNTQNGYDVWNSTIPPGVTDGPWILADDFVCTNTGPITNINIWGSWFNDQAAPKTITFWVALYDNVATNSANPYSHPGNLIWSQCFGPGQYTEVPWGIGTESFLDPGPPSVLGPESNIWCYSFPPAAPPTQTGTAANPTTYWLVVFAQQFATGPQDSFGWKTTYGVQNDISVHALWNAPFCPTNIAGLSFGWTPTYVFGPLGQQPLDLAFKIATGPSTNCVIAVACPVPDKTNECGTIWFFDPPKITAPPPCCTSPPVIQVITTNAANPCAVIYTSVWTVYDCSGATVVAVCTQTVVVVDTTPPAMTCPPSQTVECGTAWSFGTPTANDACGGTVNITVVGTVTNTGGTIPCNYSVTRTWMATDQCGNSTNCSQTITIRDTTPPVITCPTNQLVECGTPWSFGMPTAVDACSGTNVTINVLNTFTNTGVIPCNYSVTRTWVAKDQCGNTNICSQTFTIVDTTPPVITCATNKTVVYGSTWSFDPPTAFDACCGTNVTVSVVTTYTNGVTCNQTIWRVWQALDCCQNPSQLCTQVVTEVCLDCIQTNGIKYVQWPNTNHGYDLWNSSTLPPNQTTNTTWLLADDFVCTNTGFITDIHIWGSWWYDQVTNNAITFWLGIFEDTPTNVNNPFSHPGRLIWSECFAPGHYKETFWSPGTETFLDPGPPNIIASDSQVWYYCFNPSQPPKQEGRPYKNRLYWLGVYAVLPPGTPNFFGWKTTTNFQHDISVHTPWKYGVCPATLPPGNLGWTPNHDPAGLPLDLAFQITTATNCSRSLLSIDYFYPTNVVLTWPTVSVLQSSTNVLGPYLDVAGATSPWTNTWPPSQRFYRLRCPKP